MFDLRSFSLDDTYRCSAELRSLGEAASDADDAARRIVTYFYEGLLTPEEREPECRLVRLFRTLPASPNVKGLDGAPVWLSLRATRGTEPEWNDPSLSRHYRLLQLRDSNAPMVRALVAQLGIPVSPSEREARAPLFDVFHVEQARGSPLVPAQEDFVVRHGIRSVLGFGGPLPQSQVFVVVIFSKVTIPKQTAELFRTLAPSVGLALLRSEHDERSLETRVATYERIVREHERIALVQQEERERLLARAEEATAEAQAANRSKDQFLAVLGHELRNPLSPIVTAVELMKLRGDQSRELQVIERNASHLGRLVDDMLDVARIAQGKVEVHRRPVELEQIVMRALEMTRPLLERRMQRLTVHVPREGLLVSADLERLAQVVSNLVENASKYSALGSEVAILAERRGDVVRLRVRDEGIGIPRERLHSIFDAFVQHHAHGPAPGGLGLGLTIVRSLVELHGGTAFAQSGGPGKGSEFVVELPFLADATAPRFTADVSPTPPIPAPRKMRVLLVDDNEDAATLLADVLSEVGYDVRVANDGPSALAMAPGFMPQVAILDIGLPVMDGCELARRLRSLPGLPEDLKLVAVTGYGQAKDRRRSTEAGFAAHLVKPVTLDALIAAMSARTEVVAPSCPPGS